MLHYSEVVSWCVAFRETQEKGKQESKERETQEQEEAGRAESAPKTGLISNIKTWYRGQQKEKIAKAISYKKRVYAIQLGGKESWFTHFDSTFYWSILWRQWREGRKNDRNRKGDRKERDKKGRTQAGKRGTRKEGNRMTGKIWKGDRGGRRWWKYRREEEKTTGAGIGRETGKKERKWKDSKRWKAYRRGDGVID